MKEKAEDLLVVQEVLNGDTGAFEKLLRKYQREVLKIVASKVPNQDTFEVVQDVFIRAFRSLPQYSQKDPFLHWLRTIAVRTCYDYWRVKYRNREITESALSEETRSWFQKRMSHEGFVFTPRDVECFETREVLEWALGKLTPEDRMIILLVHFEGYTIHEVAEFLGFTRANVKIRAFRARKKLRKTLEKVLE